MSGRFYEDRTAIVRASYEWIDAFIPELNVRTILFDYDDVEPKKRPSFEDSASSCAPTFKGKDASNRSSGYSAEARYRSCASRSMALNGVWAGIIRRYLTRRHEPSSGASGIVTGSNCA